MAIHPSGTFSYVAVVPPIEKRHYVELRGRDRWDRRDPWLVGPHPRIQVEPELMSLAADDQADASVWRYAFPVGDALLLAMEPGDHLHVARSSGGGVGLSLLRRGQLVVAIGAVSQIPIDPLFVDVGNQPSDIGSLHDSARNDDRRIVIGMGEQRLELKARDCGQIGGYDAYAERLFWSGIPGTAECVALSAIGIPGLRIAAMRSAVLLVSRAHKIIGWDFFGDSSSIES